MTSIKHELRYAGATCVQVQAMLADPAFRERVCDAQHVVRRTVTVTGSGAGMTVTIDQVQAAQGIPSFAKRIVGEEINIVQRETWSQPTEAALTMAIPGKPGDIAGEVTLDEDAGGTTQTVRLDVKVSIPLVGGKVEGLVADLLTKALEVENRVGTDWLAERA